MRAGRIRTLFAPLAVAAALAASPAGAAAVSVEPTALGFGTVPLGGSATRSVTLSMPCSLPAGGTCPSWAVDVYYVHPAATGDFHATSDCPNPLAPPVNGLVGACTIEVAFLPTAEGQRSGTLSTGTLDLAGLFPGPVVSLLGTGLASSDAIPVSSRSTTSKRRRKCRARKKRSTRHRVASAAKKKKCKRKKRRR